MHFRRIFQQIKISRYKLSSRRRIFKNNYCNTSNVTPIKIFDKLHHQKYLNKEIIQSHSSNHTYDERKAYSLACLMTTTDDWFSNMLCPDLPELHHIEPLVTELQNSFSIENLFKVLENHKYPLNYNEACQTIYSLSNIKHLHQFKLKDIFFHVKDGEFSSSFYSHPKFRDILDIIKEESSVERLCTLMMCLDNIGIDMSNDLMIDLHLKVLKSISDLNILSLVQLSFVFSHRDLVNYYTQVHIFNEVRRKVDFDKISMKNLVFLSILYNNLHQIMSVKDIHQYSNHVKTFVDENRFIDSDVTSLLVILSTIRLLLYHNTPVYICKSIMKLFVDRIDELSPHQLSLLSNIYQNVLEPRYLLPKLQESASKFINKSENLDLKTDLLLCLSFSSGFQVRKEYETLVTEVVNHFDPRDFMSLFKALRYLKPSNHELCKTFWLYSMENIKSRLAECDEVIGMRESILRLFYSKYLYFNNNFNGKVRVLEAEQEMISLLQSEIRSSTKHIPTKLAHMIGFLIAYSREDELSDQWYELLEESKEQFKHYDVTFLSRGIEFQLQNNRHGNKGAQILSKLKSLLDSFTEDCLKDHLYLREVISLTTSYLKREGSPSSALFQKLSNEHMKHVEEINSKSIPNVLRNFKIARFTNPEVFEAISDYVITNKDDITSTMVHRVLRTFFTLGYTPKKMDFANACQAVVKAECEVMSSSILLDCCLALAFLGGLSTELIHYIFRIDFLNQMEEEIKYINSQNYSNKVRHLLMSLNRAVCLDHPEEKIPWFHDKYCQDMIEIRPFRNSAFMKEVAGVLSSIFGSGKYIDFNTKSPYYYNIDLEFGVGQDGIPRRLENNNQTSKDFTDIRRFAVLVRNKKNYTRNDYRIVGPCQMQRRHLEMLGYFVVEVLERDFYSMAVATKDEKKKLLKNLIMKEVAKES